ncbi:hypothetical protein PANDA_010806 [Ailuropoda melanoleuca]|uniref:Uncharacterized protein n=1 Tax=Ailuropoda melanoleuca TaxID=9646 RepID=D2HI23_AILME|nr:hypothetical protein PANDA_010806 [Ailuropoda melanoleuca]
MGYLTCRLLKEVQAGRGYGKSIILHPRKDILVTCGEDRLWKLVGLPKGNVLLTGFGHTDWLSSCCFHPSLTVQFKVEDTAQQFSSGKRQNEVVHKKRPLESDLFSGVDHHTEDKTYIESSLQEAKTNANRIVSTFTLSRGVSS